MTLPLLQTKLYAPPPRPHLVQRTHLLARLHDWERRLLTLISAPAGFGKTTLVSAWLVQSDCQAAWLSLDEDDNDPTRFLSYLLAAVQSQQPQLGGTAQTLLAAPQPPPAKVLLTLLLNDLGTLAAPLTLILDDYHLITTPAIHEALTFLIDHLPPLFHLVITTRIDPPLPLARWRARNQLAEIRAADLRFTPVEAAHFLNQVMGLALTDTQIATLETRTEGWIAGLQLAALSMQGRQDVTAFIQAFSGSNRHVLSYLVEEVLNRCSASTLDFLLQTAILDRLSAPLCNVVTGRSDSQRLLEALEQANLFLIPLDDEGKWYRYHQLFADVLRNRLQQQQPQLALELSGRASRWCEQNDLANQAIDYALTATDYTRSANLVEQFGSSILIAGGLQMVLGWLQKLPEAEVRNRPALSIMYAGALMFTQQLAAAEAHLRIAEESIQDDTPVADARLVRGRVATVRGNLARLSGDLARCVVLAEEGLALLPESEELMRAIALGTAANAFLVSGNVLPATESQIMAAVVATRSVGHRFGYPGNLVLLARLQILQGRLHQARHTLAEAALAAVGPSGWRSLIGAPAYYFALSDLLRKQDELAPAEDYWAQGFELISGALTVDAEHIALGYITLARLQHARGEGDKARKSLDEYIHLARQRHFVPALVEQGLAMQARLALADGDLASALRWLQGANLTADDSEILYPRENEYLTLARILIAQKQWESARDLLNRLLTAAEAVGRMDSMIEILILSALNLCAHSARTDGLHLLARAIRLGEPEGYVRVFVDEGQPMQRLLAEWRVGSGSLPLQLRLYADKLLAAFQPKTEKMPAPATLPTFRPSGRPLGPALPTLVEPLSDREQEVLQLVALGLSNTQIADRLIVTTGTVKTHLNRIFGKLAVQSRTQAIARGRELGLLDG